MSKNPSLRFSNFKSSWKDKPFKSLGQFAKSYPFSRNEEGEGEYHHIHYGDIHSKYRGIINYETHIPTITEKGPFELAKSNDIVFADASEDTKDLGKVVVLGDMKNKKIISGLHTHRFIPSENLNSLFFFYYTQTQAYRKFIYRMGTGISVLGISKGNLGKLEFPLPDIEEQKKIANFFCLMDQKITKQQEKVEQLEISKKGMIQKIFSQELRFKDNEGNDFSKWDKVKLVEIGTFRTSSVNKLIDEDEDKVFLVNYMDVYKHKRIDKQKKILLQVVSATPLQIENNNLKKSDILFTPSSETPDDIGHSIVVFEDLEDSVYSYHLLRLRLHQPENFDVFFLHYFCNTQNVRNQIVRFATGSTRFTVSIKDYNEITVDLPCKDEQEKIGKFLYKLEDKITLEHKKLKELKSLKKSLIQKMFI